MVIFTLVKPVNSTIIEKAVYDERLQELYIQFTTNSRESYCYENVSAQLWENFCQASSPGQFFNSYIRNLEFTVQEV